MRPFPCIARVVVVTCALVVSSPAQTHFTRAWPGGTPYLAMNVYVTAASCDSVPVGAGDEIGLFDGTTCVGLTVLTGPIVAGAPLSVIASTDDPTTPATDGFVPGRPVGFRIWRAVPGVEYADPSIEKTFAAGAGTYASLATAVVALTARRPTGVADRPTPQGYRLYANYPNPFNPATTIRFSLADRRSTVLKVYDLLGREVAVLVNGELDPGEHTVQFDGARLASGLYVCRMTAGGYMAQTTMILQR
jgi:hypothetical protein